MIDDVSKLNDHTKIVTDRIISNKIKSEKEFLICVRYWLSKILNKGFYDEYFDKLTDYQLLFEYNLHKSEIESQRPDVQEKKAFEDMLKQEEQMKEEFGSFFPHEQGDDYDL